VTEELHKSLHPDSQLNAGMFENVFRSVDADGDGVLTCQEMELLFYLYSIQITH
jgi:hypothetical protein